MDWSLDRPITTSAYLYISMFHKEPQVSSMDTDVAYIGSKRALRRYVKSSALSGTSTTAHPSTIISRPTAGLQTLNMSAKTVECEHRRDRWTLNIVFWTLRTTEPSSNQRSGCWCVSEVSWGISSSTRVPMCGLDISRVASGSEAQRTRPSLNNEECMVVRIRVHHAASVDDAGEPDPTTLVGTGWNRTWHGTSARPVRTCSCLIWIL